MTRQRWVIMGVVAVTIVAGAIWFLRGDEATANTPYRLAAVERGNVTETISSTGILTALQTVAIGTQVSGQVIELHADFNDRVRAGQLLARIDPTLQRQQVRTAEANIERVRADLARQEREFERSKALYEQNVITETEFANAEYSLLVARSSLMSAEINLNQAQQNLAYTEIYAPIDGIVIERNAEVGQTVAASLSTPQLFLLANDMSQLEIHANVDESEIGQIEPGQEVRFTVQAYRGETFRGTVRQKRLQSTSQENVVNYRVVISVQNSDLRLLPGMTATVDFIVREARDVFKVSNAALRFNPTPEMLAQIGGSVPAMPGAGGRVGGGQGQTQGPAADSSAPAAAQGEQGQGAQTQNSQAPAQQQGGQPPAQARGGQAGQGGPPAGAQAGPGGQGGPGGFGPGGQGGLAGMDSAQRAQMMAQARERMAAGGGAPGGGNFQGGAGGGNFQGGQGRGGQGGAGGVQGQGGPPAGQGAAPGGQAAAAQGAQAGPSTPQGAFMGSAPARPAARQGFANLWYIKDGKLNVMQVRTGVSDGVQTEIIGPDLEEGLQVIAGLNIATPTVGTNNTTNPFQQGGGNRTGGMGGGGMGGGGFGGGGGGFGGGGGRGF